MQLTTIKLAIAFWFTLLAERLPAQTFTVEQKALFNQEETLKLVTAGTSVIKGQLFARDNQNDGFLKGIAVLNVNKKQYARRGTKVVLVPYTPYFKEYVAVSKRYRKQGKVVQLPQEAVQCIKTTTVTDDRGSYSFANLMPGQYLLLTNFGYIHTHISTETVGTTDTYIDGYYQGSRPILEAFSEAQNGNAAVQKVVTLTRDGEVAKVDLKKTL